MAVRDLLVLLLLAGLLAPHLHAQGDLDLTTLPVQTEVNTIAQDPQDSTIPQVFQEGTATPDHGTWSSSQTLSSVAGSNGKVVPSNELVSSSDLHHDNKDEGKNVSSDDLGKGDVNLTSNDLGNDNQNLTSDLKDGEEAKSEYYYDDEGNGTIGYEDGNNTDSEYYYDEDGNSTESEYYYDEDGNSTEGNETNTNGTMYYDDEDEDEDEEEKSQLPEGVVKKKALHRQVPVEAVAFLGAVGCFLVLLVIFFLYLNKSLCFSECGGFPCIDKPPKKEKAFNKLGEKSETDKSYLLDGSAYQYDDDTSSDSDDEVLQHYQSSLAQGKRGSMHSSVRSAKSGRSRKSDKSKRSGKLSKSPEEQMEDSASLVEKGQASDGVSSPGSDGERESQGAGTEDMSPSVQPSLKTGSMPELDDHHMYENKAFLKDHSVSQFGSEPALSATDRTMSNDEHLFDVSDLQGEPPLISKCGSLEVSFLYEAKRGKMSVTVHQAREIPAKDRGGASNVQVRMMLLPTKKQKFKTKVKVGENPVFEESFAFTKIFPDDVHGMGIRVRLYGLERMRRERMIGESIIGFASLNLDEETTHWMVLEPRSNLSGKGGLTSAGTFRGTKRGAQFVPEHGDSGFDVSSLSRSDSASSTQSLQHGGMPELLVGLAYNGTTGRLSVEVIKGSNFRNMAMNRAPDTYVKLTLMSPTGQELQRCKTSVRRGQPNPLFKETFMFQVAQFQLPEVTVMVSVYNKKSMKKKEMIGWFSLGMNCSGEEEGSHWSDMRESKGEQVCRWHVLLES